MKKFISMLLSVCTVFGLVACGKGKEESKGDYVATVKIGYYEAGYGEGFMDYWTKEYNKAHPDEKIKFKIDPNVGASSIGSALENNAGLNDIYLSLATSWAGWARRGWIEPLDDLYQMTNEDGVKFEDAFIGGFEEYGYLDGNRYVIPQSGPAGNGFVYSEKMFNEHGWIVPTTVDELFTLIDQINNDPVNKDSNKNNDIAPFAWGGQVAAYWNTVVQMWANQIDGPEKLKDFYVNPSADKYKPENRQGLKKALQTFERMICSGEGEPINSIDGAVSKNHLLMQNDFVLGRAAMVSGVYGLVNETKDIIDPDCNLRIFFPAIEGAHTAEDGTPLNIGCGTEFDFMFIAKASKVKDYAKKFLLWISTKDMASAYIRYTHGGSPFVHNPETLGELDTLTRDMVNMASADNWVTVVGTSEHPITQYGKITVWPMGEPYSTMVLQNWSAQKVLDEQYKYVVSNWSTWEHDSGLTQSKN